MAFDPSTATLVPDAPPAFDPSTARLADDTASAPDETAGRVAGLTARAVGRGVAELPTTVANLNTPGIIAGAANAARPIAHRIRQSLGWDPPDQPAASTAPAVPAMSAAPSKLSDFIHPDKWADAVDFLADKAGIARPATPTERVLSKAAEAVPTAALAPEAPVMGALSAAAGGAASQATSEAGGSPLQQTLAGLAVGSVPALTSAGAQSARALVRNQADTAGRLADAAANGTQLTAGQATGSKFLQRVEGASSKVWGGAPITHVADAQTENLGGHIDNVVRNLSQGGDVSPTGAGNAIKAGAAAAKANMKAAEKAAYDHVDTLVHPETPIDVSGTMGKLDALAAPTPGAAATTGDLVSSKIATMRENLQADLKASQESTGNAQNAMFTAGGTPSALPAGSMPYSAVSKLRTAVGNSIDWGFSPADPVTNGSLKQVYGALSEDLKAGASKVSPDAAKAANEAASLYVANQDRRELLDSVIEKAGGPEAVYAAATNGTKQGSTKISGVMSALDPGQQHLVRATVINRLGKAIPSQQTAEGNAFNPSTFLTNWNKLDTSAKDALFGAQGPTNQLRRGLDSFAHTTSTIRNSTLYKNPSGTAAAAGHGYGLLALLGETGAAVAGHPHALAASAAAIVGNNLLARALTNPKVVTWLASSAKLPTSALPNAVNQLAAMGKVDPDARDLATALQTQPRGTQ